jgi:monofunctional biosynthetic peptidoglycan transglycosylase
MKNRSAFLATFAIILPMSALKAGTVAEFTPEEMETLGWTIVDDGVMGGLSQGQREIGKDGILRFFGTLSLENNGGFSSLRSKRIEMDLSDAEGLILRVKGDGRSYQVRLSTDAEFRGGEVSFQAEFATKKDEWIEVQVPFKNLAGSWRGMKLPDKTFDAAKVRRVGLLLGDKKQGPFALQVDWIRTHGAVSKASE